MSAELVLAGLGACTGTHERTQMCDHKSMNCAEPLFSSYTSAANWSEHQSWKMEDRHPNSFASTFMPSDFPTFVVICHENKYIRQDKALE